MAVIVLGASLLSGVPQPDGRAASDGTPWAALAIVAACLAWAIDNNLTRKVALHDAGFIA